MVAVLNALALYVSGCTCMIAVFSEDNTRFHLDSVVLLLSIWEGQQYLPDRPISSYFLRPRRHNKTLITKTSDLIDRDFIIINIYDLFLSPVQHLSLTFSQFSSRQMWTCLAKVCYKCAIVRMCLGMMRRDEVDQRALDGLRGLSVDGGLSVLAELKGSSLQSLSLIHI